MKNIFTYILLICFITIGFTAKAQQQANFLFFESNMGIINPAFTGSQGQLFGLQYRTAWMGVEDAPRVASFSYNTSEKKNASWGFNFTSDRVYVENQGVVSVDYSYKLQLSEQTNLYLGIKAGANYNNIDTDRLNRITSENNASLTGITNYINPLIGVGALLKSKNTFLGLSVPNILNSKRFKDQQGVQSTATDKPHLYMSGGTSFGLTSGLSLRPALLYRMVADAPNQLTALAKLDFKDRVEIGVGMSNNDYLSALLFLKGASNFDLGIGYEFGQRTSSTALRENTMEFVLRYRLGKPVSNKGNSSNNEQKKETIKE
jgi:type IX secretion system PorP/SprF family membrane protein